MDEASRGGTGTLKRTAALTHPIDVPSKLDEARAALESGAFERALSLSEEAYDEHPEDAEIRELCRLRLELLPTSMGPRL